jgi:hypothetical protein
MLERGDRRAVIAGIIVTLRQSMTRRGSGFFCPEM